MKESFVTSLAPEDSVQTTFLIQTKERKIARNGNPYLDLELRDATGVIRAKLWDCDRYPQEFDVDDVVRVVGQVEDFQGTPQIRLRKISRCPPEEVDLRDYFPRSSRDPEEMYGALLAQVRELPQGPVNTLLLAVLEDQEIARQFKLAPAAMSYHHAYLGGLVEHVLSLVELADQVCAHYTSLRKDLVVAGLVLHDLGKIEELSYAGAFRYTTRGKLIGHITIGLEIVREKMKGIPNFPAELRVQIEHIILSHHGQLEFGSPKEPMFPEALVVHYLDDLDSKLASMRAQYAADKDRPGDWTSRNPALKRELLKPPTP
jgi:3'-5' exoribonuclease